MLFSLCDAYAENTEKTHDDIFSEVKIVDAHASVLTLYGIIFGLISLIISIAISSLIYDKSKRDIDENSSELKKFIKKSRYQQDGSLYFNTEDWKNAIKHYDMYLAFEPNDIRVLNNKGASLSHLEKWDEAIPIFQKILDMESNDIEVKSAALNNIGLCYTELENYPKAFEAFENSLKLDPNHADTLLSIGYHFLDKLNDPEKSLPYFDKIINQNLYDKKDLADVFANKSKALFILEKYDESLNAANDALIRNDKHVKALIQKTNALFKLQQYGNSILCADISLRIDPTADVILITKANAFVELGLLKESMITTNSYLQRHPNDAIPFTNIGMALGRFGYLGLALAFFQEATKIDPLDYKSYYNIAGTLLMMRSYHYALQYFEKAYEINSQDLSFLLDMGLCLEKLNKFDAAIGKCYAKAYNMNKNNIIVLRTIKDAFKKINDDASAKLAEEISFEIGT